MNATNEPLYVVDGVPVVSGDVAISAVSGDSKSFNIMSSINPSDIENITVLKMQQQPRCMDREQPMV